MGEKEGGERGGEGERSGRKIELDNFLKHLLNLEHILSLSADAIIL